MAGINARYLVLSNIILTVIYASCMMLTLILIYVRLFMELSEVSLICKALSDQSRLQIIYLLTYGEQCACELLEQMKITQPTLSHHMKVLENCSLVISRRKGKWSHYSLNSDQWTAFRDYIESIRIAGERKDESGCCS